jgi:uncharacterized protein (DUF302 family)
MEETRYGLRVQIPIAYERAVELAIASLKDEGFGVLTTIDVQQTLKQKLDREFRKYVILGACNPPLADRALHAELEVGLLLPCNVIVYETSPGSSAVSAMAPLTALAIVGDNQELRAVATEADSRLRRALENISRRHSQPSDPDGQPAPPLAGNKLTSPLTQPPIEPRR